MSKTLDITYICKSCGAEKPDWNDTMICHVCRGDLQGKGMPSVTGTRDGFGIGRNFMHTDDKGTREITTWRQWEKAGYKNVMDCIKKPHIKEMVKEKMKKIKRNGGKSIL